MIFFEASEMAKMSNALISNATNPPIKKELGKFINKTKKSTNSFFRNKWMNEVFREGLDSVYAPDFISQKRHLDNMEVFVQITDLVKILGLHLGPDETLLAIGARLWIQQLIDNNVVCVDVE